MFVKINGLYINDDNNTISLNGYCQHETREKLKVVSKPSLTIFLKKKVITSAYSKSSNSSVFNPILQKFYEMIREIIVSKTVCGIFFSFCRSSFINNFIVKISFSTLKSPKIKYLENHLFKKKFRISFWRS